MSSRPIVDIIAKGRVPRLPVSRARESRSGAVKGTPRSRWRPLRLSPPPCSPSSVDPRYIAGTVQRAKEHQRFAGLPFAVGVMVATPDFDTAPADRRVFIQVRATGPILPCPGGSVSVATFDAAGASVDAGFEAAFL